MTILDETKRYKTSNEYLLRKVAGEYILVPVGAGVNQLNGMLTLNETFQFIWTQFQEPRSIAEVVTAAKEMYEDKDGAMERDIRQFVEESLRYGFLKEEGDT